MDYIDNVKLALEQMVISNLGARQKIYEKQCMKFHCTMTSCGIV